ncbi:MAG: flavodoxin [Bacillus sp. (in: firmicutes)]
MSNILVAYFTRSGHTEAVANFISEHVGGDLFHIVTKEKYPVDYDSVVNQAGKEQAANARPALAKICDNMDKHDVVFVGYPNWWGTMPMAVCTFLEAYNFSGKIIIPFCTNEGSGLGHSVSDLKQLCPNATIKNGLAVRGSSVENKATQENVERWLSKLGMLKHVGV